MRGIWNDIKETETERIQPFYRTKLLLREKRRKKMKKIYLIFFFFSFWLLLFSSQPPFSCICFNGNLWGALYNFLIFGVVCARESYSDDKERRRRSRMKLLPIKVQLKLPRVFAPRRIREDSLVFIIYEDERAAGGEVCNEPERWGTVKSLSEVHHGRRRERKLGHRQPD